MLTRMTGEDWEIVVRVFQACRSRRGDKGRNDRRFLEALHYFSVHNITWRALPAEFGNWNSIGLPVSGGARAWSPARSRWSTPPWRCLPFITATAAASRQ